MAGIFLGLAEVAHAAAAPFDFEVLRGRAKALAGRPYAPRERTVPDAMVKLSYDEYRLILFDEEQTYWRRQDVPYQIQFSHPGFVHDHSVQISELNAGTVVPIKFSRSLFKYDGVKLPPGTPDPTGFAGFRILGPLDRPWDELASFLGASYFRSLAMNTVYGLSARGLAINATEPDGEEFPAFEEFWIERPVPTAQQFVIYALMDSPSLAGAYRFTVTPGADTVMEVKVALYCRRNPRVLGVAPLTSMFWHGENSPGDFSDFRPEVHDSDGLMIQSGAGEWLWRPLSNPRQTRVAAFADENPRGFGLLQRDRKFNSYQDLEVHYHDRPSAWVEPVGNWGRGSVRLAELSAADETTDNIVAFWTPERLPSPGEPIDLEYKLHWFRDQIRPPAGFAVSTRTGFSRTHEPELQRFVIEFDGEELRQLGAGPPLEPVVSVGAGGKLAYQTVQENKFDKTWRVGFGFKPDGSGKPVELRCFLQRRKRAMTETWSYLWSP